MTIKSPLFLAGYETANKEFKKKLQEVVDEINNVINEKIRSEIGLPAGRFASAGDKEIFREKVMKILKSKMGK